MASLFEDHGMFKRLSGLRRFVGALGAKRDETSPVPHARRRHEGERPAALPGTVQTEGHLADLFWSHDGREVNKWLHYPEIYERHLARFVGRDVHLLEIGVSRGGSLELWRRFFGPEARIWGVDIDPACAAFDGEAAEVRIGSQDDPEFLGRVADEMGRIDVVIDDGSHVMSHVHTSFRVLFPRLSIGGTYLIEDMHTSYWTRYEGGLRRPGTVIEWAKSLVDDINGAHHREGARDSAAVEIGGLHFHDSMIVIDKGSFGEPAFTKRGGAEGVVGPSR